jgi:hypothetical protein
VQLIKSIDEIREMLDERLMPAVKIERVNLPRPDLDNPGQYWQDMNDEVQSDELPPDTPKLERQYACWKQVNPSCEDEAAEVYWRIHLENIVD